MVRRVRGLIYTVKSKWVVCVYLVNRFRSDPSFRGGLGNATAGTDYY